MATDTETRTVEPTAIEPKRVLILTDNEQRILLEALRLAQADAEAQHIDMMPGWIANLRSRIAHGDEYADPTDELDRTTLRKRRLEEEVRRANRRIETLADTVVEELIARGERKITREDTGSTLSIKRQIWARVIAGPEPTDEDKAAAKAAAADALIGAGLGAFVRPDFNLNTVSAHFREQVNNYLEEQLDLPVEQRRPRPVQDFLPEALRGVLELTDKPTISVRAAD